MGFSTSGAAAILFIGLLVAAGIAYPTFEAASDRRADAIDDRDQRAVELRNTELAVESVTYNASTDALNVTAENTGSSTLIISKTDLLVDGEYYGGYDTSVDGTADRDLWHPGETLAMNATATTRPDRVKVVTQYGVADVETEVTDG